MTLTIDNLSKRYGSTVALDGVSFEVQPGELFGFVGSNGAGKTTTMRIALGVLAADGGEVRLSGKPVDLDVRRTIGYMPEERGLYPKMKVGNQLIYLARLHGLSKRDATAAMQRWTERLGIAERIGDTVDSLSLGNQQRVQLAAALIHDPAVLVLDEPFSGLDPVAVDVMSEVLVEKANTGVPVIFSSHQLDLVQRLCERVGIIVHGRMRVVGAVDDLRAEGASRLVVHAPDAPAGWADGLPGVSGSEYTEGRTVLTIEPGTDDQQILKTALSTGPVHEFSLQQPSLTDLFREVVAA
ncbi:MULTISPECIES: ABC transporter ATP-binding protein [unclassified Rhodococcus (in: high G+C Gram-positive bacteria)]|uniref:ABC transporter ATP-binding protein n=1 Tax=unclassified Rhodococcus (in: high G+C Gram-positive bacteria) TaxID=192944 RepID=UPI00146A7BE8|nr:MULTISPECIES: ATP-binding cassette domain-containing protein [unclassified Rhodococcus (in: high G+C Gram-positive bacteria)]MBF0660560.1 ATP-binding cassette domain-containing protein [Rhodococcus sp. (in: high G+C Gram-positive bacteria)]NMD95847.1 ATP-binding cassette domain-containing protein [Rhodococcus sp. BL-253-APC-6A1W]NME78785.1 ATP-binding cassette domain-containing protein [Rhodococcus sp. 105337]